MVKVSKQDILDHYDADFEYIQQRFGERKDQSRVVAGMMAEMRSRMDAIGTGGGCVSSHCDKDYRKKRGHDAGGKRQKTDSRWPPG